MSKNICLIGNPNCGKTTLFNKLTGAYQKTGNWSGVTTESKTGKYKTDKSVNITDLPGIYSLSAFSDDEKAVMDYLKNQHIDVIINVVDGTNLERNLFLTLKLRSLNIPIVVAINMIDDLNKNGITVNEKSLSKYLGVPVISISAKKAINIESLMNIALNEKIPTPPQTLYFKDDKKCYEHIEKIINTIINKKATRSEKITLAADKVLLSAWCGIPIFFVIMTVIYFLSFTLGKNLSDYLTELFKNIAFKVNKFLLAAGFNDAVGDLISNAVIKGIGSVIAFLPQILVLYGLMTIVEESGYAARITFLFDKIFRLFGLGGRAILPFILSCGCTVSGISATRTIENANEKYMTIFLAPNMPCGAKTAVFGWFSYVFFNGSALAATSMYVLGIISVIIFGKILKKFKPFNNSNGGFLMEMPTLRIPMIKDVLLVLYRKTKEFLIKAGSVIFAVSVVLWVLTNFGFSGYTQNDVTKSFLYYLGNGIKYILYPLGVRSWQCSVAMLSGVLAKEAIIETLSFLASDYTTMFNSIYSVYAFMAFILLSPPCIATLSAAKRELKDNKLLVKMIVFELLSSYSVAVLINFVGNLILSGGGLILSVIVGIIILIAAIKVAKKNIFCYDCKNCIFNKNKGLKKTNVGKD